LSISRAGTLERLSLDRWIVEYLLPTILRSADIFRPHRTPPHTADTLSSLIALTWLGY